MKQYGLPYRGSKSTIAARIVEALPPGSYLLEMFCGGGAVTHAAFKSGKFKRITAVDDYCPIIELLKSLWSGELDIEHFPFISRNTFQALKNIPVEIQTAETALALLVASFSFNAEDYLWSASREDVKTLLHKAVAAETRALRREALRQALKMILASKDCLDATACENLLHNEQLQSLERVARVQDDIASIRQRGECVVEFVNKSVFDVDWHDADVCYCDPPYKSAQTDYHRQHFDFERFYDLLQEMRAAGKTVFVSEYALDVPGFREVASFKKCQSVCATKNISVEEKLFACNF